MVPIDVFLGHAIEEVLGIGVVIETGDWVEVILGRLIVEKGGRVRCR